MHHCQSWEQHTMYFCSLNTWALEGCLNGGMVEALQMANDRGEHYGTLVLQRAPIRCCPRCGQRLFASSCHHTLPQ